jgi:hypothetical protein
MTNGWDERDYKFWSQLQSLPSYGLVTGKGNKLIALSEVEKLLKEAAEKRWSEERRER